MTIVLSKLGSDESRLLLNCSESHCILVHTRKVYLHLKENLADLFVANI